VLRVQLDELYEGAAADAFTAQDLDLLSLGDRLPGSILR